MFDVDGNNVSGMYSSMTLIIHDDEEEVPSYIRPRVSTSRAVPFDTRSRTAHREKKSPGRRGVRNPRRASLPTVREACERSATSISRETDRAD